MAIKALEEPKTGHWIVVENEEMETVGYYCSECDLPMETEQRTNFCPNCGAKMIEPQESGGRVMKEKFSDAIMEIQAGYLVNGCEGCPFYGIEEYEIKQRCDSVPINCVWWQMHIYFKQAEQGEADKSESEE